MYITTLQQQPSFNIFHHLQHHRSPLPHSQHFFRKNLLVLLRLFTLPLNPLFISVPVCSLHITLYPVFILPIVGIGHHRPCLHPLLEIFSQWATTIFTSSFNPSPTTHIPRSSQHHISDRLPNHIDVLQVTPFNNVIFLL